MNKILDLLLGGSYYALPSRGSIDNMKNQVSDSSNYESTRTYFLIFLSVKVHKKEHAQSYSFRIQRKGDSEMSKELNKKRKIEVSIYPPDLNQHWSVVLKAEAQASDHADWRNQLDDTPTQVRLTSTKEEAENIAKAWTPALVDKLMSKPEYYYVSDQFLCRRGWLTPAGRKKFNRVNESLGHPFTVLALDDSHLRHGITFDILYLMSQWQSEGRAFLLRRKWCSDMRDVQKQLEDPTIPPPVRKWYDEFNKSSK